MLCACGGNVQGGMNPGAGGDGGVGGDSSLKRDELRVESARWTKRLPVHRSTSRNPTRIERLFRRRFQLVKAQEGGNDALEDGRRLIQRESWTDAVETLKRAASAHPDDPEPQRLIGVASARLEDWGTSAHAFARVVELGATTFDVWVGLGQALARLPQPESAAKALAAALAMRPDDVATRLQIGAVLERLGRHDEALEHYARATALAPENLECHLHTGRVLCNLSRWDEARAALEHAETLGLATPLLYFRLGNAHAGVGKTDLAAAAYQRAIDLAPEWSQPRRHMGDLLAAQGRWKESAGSYLDAIKSRPEADYGIESYLGGLGNTTIMEIICVRDRLPAYEELAIACEAEGRGADALLVRTCIEQLRSGSADPARGRALPPSIRTPEPGIVAIPREDADGVAYSTDKLTSPPECLDAYAEMFAPWVSQPVVLLELGMGKGGSLMMWRDYFPRGTIVGVDVSPVPISDSTGRIRVYAGYQEDLPFLNRIFEEVAPYGCDIVIDDASHRGDMTRTSFNHIFYQHLRPGGLYVIEDWQTGYMPDWPDGSVRVPRPDIIEVTEGGASKKRLPSHDFGMVGFVKQLLDRADEFERIVFVAQRVFVFKKVETDAEHIPRSDYPAPASHGRDDEAQEP